MQAWWLESACLLCFLVLASVVPGHALRAKEDGITAGHRRRLVTKEVHLPGGGGVRYQEERQEEDEEEERLRHQREQRIQRIRKSSAERKAEAAKVKEKAAQAKEKAAARVALGKLVANLNRSRLQDEDNPFRNMLLVIHCRVLGSSQPYATSAVCAERAALYEPYKRFFPDVYYMHDVNCQRSPNTPHHCLADLMEGQAAERDGLFYMHFDALIRPEHMGLNFNKLAIGTFDETQECGISALGEQVNCSWNAWSPKRAPGLQGAILAIRQMGPEYRALSHTTFYLGNDDLFYIPRSAFRLYRVLATEFRSMNVQHEVGGPTMRHILHQLTSAPLVNMQCTGGCCSDLERSDALSPEFRCGHAFDLNQSSIREVIPIAILT